MNSLMFEDCTFREWAIEQKSKQPLSYELCIDSEGHTFKVHIDFLILCGMSPCTVPQVNVMF